MRLLRQLDDQLEAIQPRAIIIIGYGQLPFLVHAWRGRNLGIPTGIWLETTSAGSWLKRLAKSWIMRRLDFAIAAGTRASGIARQLGFPPTRTAIIGNPVDNSHFAAVEPTRASKRFLTVARLSPEKNHHRLLEAFRRYRAEGGTWSLSLVGDGPSRDTIRAAIAGAEPEMLGWVAYEDMPGVHAKASGFVLPSTYEPWGLVVNEALAAGLPVAVSRAAGCVPDLLSEGNGRTFDPTKIDQLVESLHWLEGLSDEEWLHQQVLGRSAIQKMSPEQTAQRFWSALDAFVP